METGKIILVIVEGKTDEIALGRAIQSCCNDEVRFIRINGDILCKNKDQKTNVKNVVSTIEAKIKEELKRAYLKPGDVSRIIQITDTDGTFVLNQANLISDISYPDFFYEDTAIKYKERALILKRNMMKSGNIKKLLGTKEICRIPYQLFFMSCNLDHVIVNERNLPHTDKSKMAANFEREIGVNKNLFENFLKEHLTPGASTFEESWDYLKIGTHSLDRHTNLYFAINGTNS